MRAPTAELPIEERNQAPVDHVRPVSAHHVRPSRMTYWRRRAVAVTVLLVVAFLLTAVIGRVGAEAELEDKIQGHVVVQPGETLWDVAAQSAPEGVDTREQLRAVAELNGLDSSSVDAWSVVLIPAR